MEDEKRKVLEMLEQGKISADEASKLLDAMGNSGGSDVQVRGTSSRKRWLKIRVYEAGSEKPKVRVTLPMGLIRMATKFVPNSAKLQLSKQNIDLREILREIESVEGGKLVDVYDEEGGEHVEITIE